MYDKIMVIDDEQFVREFWEKVFMKQGYLVRCASSAEEALEIVADDAFDVFFIDINLPEMNGIELFEKLKPERPTSMFFAMTGYSAKYDLAKCREIGFDDYFHKPYELELMISATKRAFQNVKRWARG